MKTKVWFYWTNFLQPEHEPSINPNSYRFDVPPEGWVLVRSVELEVPLLPRELLAAEAIHVLDKGIEKLKKEFYEKVTVLEAQKNKFLVLTM